MMRSLDHNSYHLYQITTRFIQTMTDIQTSKVCLVSATPDAEKHMAYCARVSNPKNQNNESIAGLLKYCIKHQHWSIFEQAFMTLEINTSRAIAAQILRHRSFTFQEFSQRYADSSLLGSSIPVPELRRQDTKNRQNSINDIDHDTQIKYEALIEQHFRDAMSLYSDNALMMELQRNVLGLYCL